MGIFFKRMISLVMAFCILAGLLPALAFTANAEDSVNTDLGGKTISILGDSISTFTGVSNDASVNASLEGGAIYYSAGTLGVNRTDTWWQQTIDALGLRLLVNNSWSGSCVLHTRSGTEGAFVDRCVQLHNDRTGEEPDIIVVFLGTNDFSYYQSALGSADIDYDTLITAGDNGTCTYAAPATTCEAYAIMLHKMVQRYPNAKIYCMGMTARRSPDKSDSYADVGQPTAFNAQLQAVIEYFGLTYVDLENCGMDAAAEIFDMYMGDGRVHPNALGMDKITQALVGAMLGRDVVLYSVSGEYAGVAADNTTASVISGETYRTSLTLLENYSDLRVTVTMGGLDITASCYVNGVITIPNVTGDIAITATANREPRSFKWEYHDGELVSAGEAENVLTKLTGSCTEGVFTDTRYQLAEEAVLRHDLPWTVEWKGEGTGGFMLSEKSDASAAPFFFRRAGNYLNAFGSHDGSKYNNYGLTYSDGASNHTYRLENRIAGDGSNLVYLLVDGAEIGTMTDYYVAGTAQGTTGDWVCGKDFSIKYIGSSSHPLTNYSMEYLLVSECVHTYENGTCTGCGAEEPNPYKGKTIACIGDSITYGVGVTRDETDYVTLLAESLEMDYIRLGASGTTLCAGGHATCNIGKLTESNLSGADVVTILMGINDFVQARNGYYSLGTMDSADTSTIYGAAHMWCQRIVELRQMDSLKDTEFYFLTPVITSWNNSVSSVRNWDQGKENIHGYTLRDLCNAIIEVCALYDIPVIDLNLVSGLYYNSAEDNTVTEFGGDGAHPGTVGHRMMAEAIENRLLQNHLRDDHDHSYGSWITTRYPDCDAGEQQRVCSVCTTTEKQKLDGMGHTYENGICTICGAEHTNLANYQGKVISILGDSISTFDGYIPVADGFNLEHLPRYPQADLLTDVNETWWMQVIESLDAKLGINDSWRGATCSGAHPVTTGTTGENAAMANLTRIQNLGSNGTPDVILFYGGTNDLAHVSKVGTFDPETAPDTVDLTTKSWDNLADGYVNTILRLQYYYPDAQIVCLLPNQTKSYYTDEKLAKGNAVLAAICQHYGVAYTDLRECSISINDLPDGIHPDAAGMDYITQAVVDALLNQCQVEPGENTVYPVTHDLQGVTASLGHFKGISAGEAFTETLTGENLTVTVTMGGQDITESACRDGVISIDAVTGALHITARGEKKAAHADYLQQLLGQVCCGCDLWKLLEHDREYYTANGWGVHSSGNVRSVTIPVQPGQRIWATSFQAGGSNGGTLDGIRVTWFGPTDVLKSVTNDKVYEEFAANGWLTVPEGAVAVNIPMWTSGDENELYILTLDHSYENGICTICGAVLGDLDSDGDVDAYDLTILARHVGGIEPVTGRALLNADVDGDGDVDANDLTRHARYVGGIITSWDQE